MTTCSVHMLDSRKPGSFIRGIFQARSGLLFPSPEDLPDSGSKPTSPVSPALAGEFFTTEPPGKPLITGVRPIILVELEQCGVCTPGRGMGPSSHAA